MQTLIQKYDLLGCVQCGKCTGSCPIALKSELRIRRLVYEAIITKDFQFDKKELWDCTTCATCELRCPKKAKPLDFICELRSRVIEKGRIPTTLRNALESTLKHKNPWGRAKEKRSDWCSELGIKRLDEGKQAELLLYVGCTPAYDPRCQNIAKALAKIFQSLKVNFGILGNEECCCGNEMKKAGEEGLFELLAEENISVFKKHNIDKIITISPHCYNTFKNDYPKFGAELNVKHYTEFLSELLEKGSLNLKSVKENKVITFHDPCYLGKRNKTFEEPRKIIAGIKNLEFREFDRCKETSLCCEGGGGRMWLESEVGKERLSEVRVKDAIELGAEIILTSCPFCLLTLEDAVKTTNSEDKIKVMDLAEITAEALS
ncbi:MAG: (Fe-S)-binding protein [Candidatus Thermoplasmatota archaeon]|nr:(Fe-S)-binding protein [Candidatus Thermoplasmatota archaeon]